MNGMQLRQVENISDGMESWPAEIILVHDDEQVISGFEDHMQSHLSGVMDTIHSNPYYLEVVGYQVGKGYAMSALVQKLGIGMDEVLAIGDGEASGIQADAEGRIPEHSRRTARHRPCYGSECHRRSTIEQC